MNRLVLVLILAAVAVALSCLFGSDGAADAARATTPREAVASPAASKSTAPPRAAPERTAAALTRTELVVPGPRFDFDAALDRLVALGVAMWEAAEREDRATVDAVNRDAEAALRALHNACPDAGERALDRRTRATPTGATVRDLVRRHVLERILRDVLAQRWRAGQTGLDRAPLDTLVAAMLSTLSAHVELAQALGDGLLVDQPYLGPSHEPQVLDLAEHATAEPAMVGVVAGLLRTLWRNLESTGAQTSDRLAGLALLLLEDGNEARRLAALRQLLVDPRYREFVVDQIVRRRDVALTHAIATAAANELAPAEALHVLERLGSVGGDALLGPFVLLGSRDPGLLIAEYERVLAANVRPALRAELVTGACANGDALGREAARVAFALDPDPEVRMRALFALAGDPDIATAEATLHAALDDPARRADATWLAGVALALQNLSGAGDGDALARIGERLLANPALDAEARRGLESLLAEHVPRAR